MRINNIKFEKASFKLINPVRVTFGTISEIETIISKIETDEGIYGYGEASPFSFVTGDNIDTALVVGKEISKRLIGEDALCIGRIHNIMDSMYIYNGAIKSAFDIALYDIAAKKMGVPLYKYLGGFRNEIESDSTVGIGEPEEMARISMEYVNKGFRILKIKLGIDAQMDVERIAKIREKVGKDIILRVDANQGWSCKEAIKTINKLEKYDVELIEQPVVSWNREALKEIKSHVNLPIVADESCHTPQDAAELVKNNIVDGINIKLMKCGGIYEAEKINAIAEANGIFCMVGCMGESRIANTAGMHFVAAHKNVIIADLDTVFSIDCDWIKGGFTSNGGTIKLTDEPGLGVTVEGF